MAEKLKDGGVKLPSAQVLKTCISRASGIEADLAESRGELGSFVKEAEEKHNIHRKAFKLTRQLDRMDETKLAEFLRHFDHYRKVTKLDEKAGTDLFAQGEGGSKGDGEGDVRPPHLKQREADRKVESNGAEKLAGLTPLTH